MLTRGYLNRLFRKILIFLSIYFGTMFGAQACCFDSFERDFGRGGSVGIEFNWDFEDLGANIHYTFPIYDRFSGPDFHSQAYVQWVQPIHGEDLFAGNVVEALRGRYITLRLEQEFHPDPPFGPLKWQLTSSQDITLDLMTYTPVLSFDTQVQVSPPFGNERRLGFRLPELTPLRLHYDSDTGSHAALFNFEMELLSPTGGGACEPKDCIFDQARFSWTLTPLPEPSTWLSLIVGFGAIGFALRRRPASAFDRWLRAAHAETAVAGVKRSPPTMMGMRR